MEQQEQDYWKSAFQREEPATRVPTSDERTMAILCHVLPIFFWIFPPLIIYLIKKDESAWVSEHAKESLNFQFTWTLAAILLAISLVGIVVIWAVPIFATIFCIVASVKASENKLYRYPLTWRIVK